MQEIISILKTLVQSNTVNFIIMVILLYVILKKVHIGAAFEKMVEAIRNNIEKSEQTKSKSLETLETSQAKMAKLPEDIALLEKTSSDKIKAFEDKINSNTQKTIADLNGSVKRIMEIEEKKISNLVTKKTSKESVDLAKNKLIDLLKKEPELHNQFIQQSLDELDKVKIQ